MSRTEATCEYLGARRRLFDEILAVTQDLNDALTIEEVTSDSLGIIDSLIAAREALMEEVDSLDARYRGVEDAQIHRQDGGEDDPGGQRLREDDFGDAASDMRRTVQALMDLQKQIDERLKKHKARVQERIKDVRSRRSGLSGYYNTMVASRSRYVDAKK